MTISDKLKKATNTVLSAAKQKVADTITNERARNDAQKTAWKDMGDGKRARNMESYGEFVPAIIWVISNKVYATDVYKANVVEITGSDAEKFAASSKGAAAITETIRVGFGHVSPIGAQIPDYLTGAHTTDHYPKPRKTAQTYEEWMGMK